MLNCLVTSGQSDLPAEMSSQHHWNLLEMQILGSLLRSAESETLGVGPRHLCLNKYHRCSAAPVWYYPAPAEGHASPKSGDRQGKEIGRGRTRGKDVLERNK